MAAAGATGMAVRTLVRRAPDGAGSGPPPAPAADAGRLTAATAQIATAYGDRDPVAVSAVATTRERALAVATPTDVPPQHDTTPVYLVVMRGRFTALTSQSGVRAARGDYLFLVLDRATLGVLDLAIGDRPPPVSLASLGQVAHLEPVPAPR